jgi:competence protein ComEC
MALLWVTLACLAGILAGGSALQSAQGQALPLLACGVAGWLWLLPAALLPLTPLLNRWAAPAKLPMHWPASAGFRQPLRSPTPALVAACALAIALGALRAMGAPVEPCWGPADLAFYNAPAEQAFDRSLPAFAVHGFISRYVADATGRVRLTVNATALEDAGRLQPLSGGVTLLADGEQVLRDGLRYGMPVRLWGAPSTPPVFTDFSYRDYLARHGVHSQMALGIIEPRSADADEGVHGNPLLRALYPVRKQGERLLNNALPEPYAALANGMLLGVDANIPDETMAAFNDTSSSHVLVISGSNVALLSGLVFALGRRLWSARTAAVVSLGAIALYALLVGGEPSVVRAAVMGGMAVLAVALARRSTALVSLAAAALAMAILNPHVLHDVGFQLSAAATVGLVLLTPLLPGGRTLDAARIAGEGLASPLEPLWATLRDALVVTLAASIAVQPLLLYHFQRASLVGLLTNLLIVPVQPMILVLGSGGLLLGLLGGLVGGAPLVLPLLWSAWLGLAWTLQVVEATASWRWASIAIGGYGATAMVATYVVLGLLIWQSRTTAGARGAPARADSPRLRAARMLSAPAATGALLLVGALLWTGVAALPDGRLTVRALESDRGDLLIVTLPSGGQMLVDGGGDTGRLLTAAGGALPLWDRTIELLLLTVDDKRSAETQAALPARMQIRSALSSSGAGEANDLWRRALQAQEVPLLEFEPGGWADLGDGVSLWALPAKAGEPVALKLVHGDFSLLLPGSARPPAPADAAANAPLFAADVLVAPDIRDGADLAAEWIAAAHPSLVLSWEDGEIALPAQAAPLVHAPAAHGPLTLVSNGAGWTQSAP